jgi:hypothetical protein
MDDYKVQKGCNWIETYRKIVSAKAEIKDSTGVRKIRAGHILIELNKKTTASEIAERMKAAVGDDTESRVILELKNIDPLSTREGLIHNICNEWKFESRLGIGVKALRMAPWDTQQMVLVAPVAIIPTDTAAIKIRTGLTIATEKIIINVVRCFRYHMLRHTSARCTALSPDKELCRRYGDKEQPMASCQNEPRCAVCLAD